MPQQPKQIQNPAQQPQVKPKESMLDGVSKQPRDASASVSQTGATNNSGLNLQKMSKGPEEAATNKTTAPQSGGGLFTGKDNKPKEEAKKADQGKSVLNEKGGFEPGKDSALLGFGKKKTAEEKEEDKAKAKTEKPTDMPKLTGYSIKKPESSSSTLQGGMFGSQKPDEKKSITQGSALFGGAKPENKAEDKQSTTAATLNPASKEEAKSNEGEAPKISVDLKRSATLNQAPQKPKMKFYNTDSENEEESKKEVESSDALDIPALSRNKTPTKSSNQTAADSNADTQEKSKVDRQIKKITNVPTPQKTEEE